MIAEKFLETNVHKLAICVREHQLNLSSSKTEFVCFSRTIVQRSKSDDTIIVDFKLIKKSEFKSVMIC